MRHLFVIVFVLLCYEAKCQQEEHPTLYMMDPYLYNSASSGFTEGLNATIWHTNQWIGIEESPKQFIGTIHKLLKETNYSMGGVISFEKLGVSKLMETEVSGTYRFLVADETWLSMNVGGGMRYVGKDYSLLRQDADPYFDWQEKREVVARFRMGVWLQFESGSYLSFGARGVGDGHKRAFGHKQATHFYLSGRKTFRKRKGSGIEMNGLIHVAKYSPIDIVISPSYHLRSSWKFGVNCHVCGVFSPFVRLDCNEHFFLGYMYGISTSRLNAAGSTSSMAFMVGLRNVSSKKKEECNY